MKANYLMSHRVQIKDFPLIGEQNNETRLRNFFFARNFAIFGNLKKEIKRFPEFNG